MAGKFVKLQTVDKNEWEQMRIYSTLRCYRILPAREKETIRSLCADVGAEWGKALFQFLTTDLSFPAAVRRHCIPEGTLRRMRAEVYRRWPL